MNADVGLPRVSLIPPDGPDADVPSAFEHPTSRLRPGRGDDARVAARHASPSLARKLVSRHGARFTSFSVIGGVLFLAGLTFQAALTSGLHVPSILSYVAQAVLSVEASFLLNRWLTWRKRATAFWPSFGRYNLQKTITVAANLLLYAGLLRLGMNYLIANVLLTAVFTIVNYIGGDRFVFTPGNVDAEPLAAASVDSYQDGPRSRVASVSSGAADGKCGHSLPGQPQDDPGRRSVAAPPGLPRATGNHPDRLPPSPPPRTTRRDPTK